MDRKLRKIPMERRDRRTREVRIVNKGFNDAIIGGTREGIAML